jgi:hypothetical protein
MDVYGVPPEGFLTAGLETEDEEEDWEVSDTSRDKEIARKLFSDLNQDMLVLPDDDNVIVISDS